MRELKFRVQFERKDLTKGWIYAPRDCSLSNLFDYIDIANHVDPVDLFDREKDENITCIVLPSTLGQWTGLKDKNGVDIYEGDIIREQENIIGETSYECLGVVGKRKESERKVYVVHWQRVLPCGFVAIAKNRYTNPPPKDGYPKCISWVRTECLDSYDFSNHQREYEIIGTIHDGVDGVKE